MRHRLLTLVTIGLLMPCWPAAGHHGSNVVYDLTQSITLTGTVTRLQFVNPHALVYFNVTSEDGSVLEWFAGLPSASRLGSGEGWTRDTLKPGDTITVTGAPTRSGAPSVWTEQITRNGEPLLKERYTG